MPTGNEPVLIGKIMSTHGVHGQLRVFLFSGEFSSISRLSTVMVLRTNREMESFGVAATAQHGKKFLLTLSDLDDVNKVANLVGCELYVKSDQLPELPEGEYYWRDLVGLQVVTDEGKILGQVSEIFATGSNDVYVIKGDDREYLIPALEDVVFEVNLEQGYMKVRPPDGLLDL